MAQIRIEGVTKTFGSYTAVDNLSLTIKEGEFMVLLGPSGCGKTTLLRMIAGFERPDKGRILIGERDMTNLPPRARDLAMVFQSYALFPHMKVYDNIAFGLRMHRVGRSKITSRVERAAALMHIEELLQRYPNQLSGGQKQRVAIARALSMDPLVLLMDEPLSNLDAQLRLQMRAELKALLKKLGTTTVYVTHDQVEALGMGDRIAVMKDGAFLQVDAPMAVYDRPANVFIAQFIGDPPMNVLNGEVIDGQLQIEAASRFQLGIRAENIELSHQPSPFAIEAKVQVVEPLGSHLLLTVQLGQQRLKATTRTDFQVSPGDVVWLTLNPDALRQL